MNKRLINQKFIKSLCVAILAFALIIAGFNVFATPATEETGTTDPILVATDSGAEKPTAKRRRRKLSLRKLLRTFLDKPALRLPSAAF